MIPKNIFKNYDIRGTYPYSINIENIFKIGNIFAAQYLHNGAQVVVGHDARPSSHKLSNALMNGMQHAGAKIIDIGCTTTPALYYTDQAFGADASIMVTASHNPLTDNGLKIILHHKPFFGLQLQNLYTRIVSTSVSICEITPIEKRNIHQEYISSMLHSIPNNISPRIKCVWDAGGGSASSILHKLVTKLPNTNWVVNASPGAICNQPDPTHPHRREALHRTIKKHQADYAVTFDADADRLCVMLPGGDMVHGDQLTMIFARDILSNNHNPNIIVDIKTSHILQESLTDLGGNVITSKTGHPWIKQNIRTHNAIFGGEYSGHLFFNDCYYGFDDGIYAALRLLSLVSKHNKSLEQLLDILPKTYASAEIAIKISNRHQLISKLKQMALEHSETLEMIEIDGIKVIQKHGWWLARFSNTTHSLIIRAEATQQKHLTMIYNQIQSFLAQCGIDYDFTKQ